MTLGRSALLASIATAMAAPACTSAAADLANPHWLALPSSYDIMAAYPRNALSAHLNGKVLMRCRVLASGKLGGCIVLAESPENQGFGEGALTLSTRIRMQPPEGDISRSSVTIPLRFRDGDAGIEAPSFRNAPGGSAALVTIVRPGAKMPGHMFDCPSAADPTRRCQSHPVLWKDDRDLATLNAIADIDLTSGMAVLECRPLADGSLADCKLKGDTSPKTEAAALKIASLLSSGPKAQDGTPVSAGRILIEFDWAVLQQLKRQPPP